MNEIPENHTLLNSAKKTMVLKMRPNEDLQSAFKDDLGFDTAYAQTSNFISNKDLPKMISSNAFESSNKNESRYGSKFANDT